MAEVFHSGVVPHLIEDGVRKFVLITSKRGHWGFPKGLIEDGHGPCESAALEALEEAGVAGTVRDEPRFRYDHPKWNGPVTVDMYLMAVATIHDEWDEDHQRGRAIVSYEAALELIRPEIAAVLEWARDQMAE